MSDSNKISLNFAVKVDENQIIDGRDLAGSLIYTALGLLVVYGKSSAPDTSRIFAAIANEAMEQFECSPKSQGQFFYVGTETDREKVREHLDKHLKDTEKLTLHYLNQGDSRTQSGVH